jgi:hypothetical protein
MVKMPISLISRFSSASYNSRYCEASMMACGPPWLRFIFGGAVIGHRENYDLGLIEGCSLVGYASEAPWGRNNSSLTLSVLASFL